MNLAQQSATYQTFLEFIPRSSSPNVVIGGPVRISSGFPIEAFGNDGLLEVWEIAPAKPAQIGKLVI